MMFNICITIACLFDAMKHKRDFTVEFKLANKKEGFQWHILHIVRAYTHEGALLRFNKGDYDLCEPDKADYRVRTYGKYDYWFFQKQHDAHVYA